MLLLLLFINTEEKEKKIVKIKRKSLPIAGIPQFNISTWGHDFEILNIIRVLEN
jgi:hypothetical protein